MEAKRIRRQKWESRTSVCPWWYTALYISSDPEPDFSRPIGRRDSHEFFEKYILMFILDDVIRKLGVSKPEGGWSRASWRRSALEFRIRNFRGFSISIGALNRISWV
jgi:hypothetical protein